MKISTLSAGIAISVGLLLAGCNVQEPSTTQPVQDAAAPVAGQEPSTAEPAPAPKVDPATADSLEAGLKVMQPRIVSKIDAYSKIEPKAFRLFMHPDQGKNAVVEFDTHGLTEVTLSPYIFDFTGDKGCEAAKDGGIVDVAWSLDGGAPNKVTVDRNYVGLLPIDLTNTSRLKLEVSEGNGVPWCDWAGIGFINSKP